MDLIGGNRRVRHAHRKYPAYTIHGARGAPYGLNPHRANTGTVCLFHPCAWKMNFELVNPNKQVARSIR